MEALLFVFGIQGTHSIFVCSCSAAALSSILFLGAFYTPEEIARSPEGVFGGRSLSSLCGPVAFRGVAPHHRPIHPERFHRIPATSHGGVSYQLRVLCFGLATAPHVFTRLRAPISTILHRYVVGMLRYLDDWLILPESRTTGIQARDRLLQACEKLRLRVNCRKSSLVPSQDMTYLDMQIQSVRFITKPTETWVGNLLRIIEEFLSSLGPPSNSLASSSGPPFVPFSSGEEWAVKDAVSPDSPQVQVGLPRRITSHPLGSSVSGGSFMVVLGDSKREGVVFPSRCQTWTSTRTRPTSAGAPS